MTERDDHPAGPALELGPVLRYVGETTAAVWVQLDRAATVTVTCWAVDRLRRSPAQPKSGLGCSTRTFEVRGHHYALLTVTGLEPDTTYPYEVAVDGEVVWPPRVSPYPPSSLRTRGSTSTRRQRIVFGSCRYAKVPPFTEPKLAARLGIDALDALRRRDGPPAARGVAGRAAAARRPGLRRRADPAEPPPDRRAPRPPPGLARRRDRRLRRVRRALLRLVGRPGGALAAVVASRQG